MIVMATNPYALCSRLQLALYCGTVNVMNAVRGKKYRIFPAGEEGIILADDGEAQICFRLLRRGNKHKHNKYKYGIMQHVARLVREYHLDQIDVVPGGVFIDCGANIGELGFWARRHGLDYIPFEPEVLESRCCDLNNFGGRSGTRRLALWNDTTRLAFYSKPDREDSSLIDPGGNTVRTQVSADTLDNTVNIAGVSGTVILKIEAEGAEPEVLEGARRTLAQIDWVTVDCGYERGKAQSHTFMETNRFLLDAGFRLQSVEFHRVAALYRNMNSRSRGE